MRLGALGHGIKTIIEKSEKQSAARRERHGQNPAFYKVFTRNFIDELDKVGLRKGALSALSSLKENNIALILITRFPSPTLLGPVLEHLKGLAPNHPELQELSSDQFIFSGHTQAIYLGYKALTRLIKLTQTNAPTPTATCIVGYEPTDILLAQETRSLCTPKNNGKDIIVPMLHATQHFKGANTKAVPLPPNDPLIIINNPTGTCYYTRDLEAITQTAIAMQRSHASNLPEAACH
ncbi:MAG: hypothetical protein AB7E52_09605 [Bdellovibrionales bacterium]